MSDVNKENKSIEYNEDYSLIKKVLGYFFLFMACFLLFTFAIVKVYAGDVEDNFKDFDIISLNNNCNEDLCFYQDRDFKNSVTLMLSNNVITRVFYVKNYNNNVECMNGAKSISKEYSKKDFYPVNSKHYFRGLIEENNNSYIIKIECVESIKLSVELSLVNLNKG